MKRPLVCIPFAAACLLWAPATAPAQAVKAAWFTPAAAASPASAPARLVAAALSYLGVPYVHAGDSRAGMDCSGLVYRVFFDTLGTSLSRGVEGLFHSGPPVGEPLHVGDLLFFDTGEKLPPSVPTHVGIYIGGGRLVHAASEGSRTGVIVSVLSDPYYRDRFLGARRLLPWRAPVLPVVLTDDKESSTEREPFASGETVTIQVYNRMSGGGPVSLSLLKDGREVLSRWVVPGGRAPAEVSFPADPGSWSVHIARIFKGRELSDVAFSVVE